MKTTSDEWTLTTSKINATSFTDEPYVANGYIGARLPVEGVGLRINPAINYAAENGTQGWPLFTLRQTASIVAGFYDHQNETKGTNFNSSATYRVGVDLDHIQAYSQSMSLRNGIVQTKVSWTPFKSSNGSEINLRYTVLAHRSRANLGLVRLDVSGLSEGQQVTITDALDGDGAQRVEGEKSGKLDQDELSYSIYSSVRPVGISNVTAWEISTLKIMGKKVSFTSVDVPESVGLGTSKSTAAQSYSVIVPSGGRLTVFKAVGIASSDAFRGIERKTALTTAKRARSVGWNSLVSEHTKAWESLWSEGGEVVIHGADNNKAKNRNSILDDLHTTATSSVFHLLANVRQGTERSGLGDNSIAPAGLTSDSYAGGIFWDAETWMYPSLLSLFPSYATRIGPCYDYEYHLNNDIALAQWQYFLATGNKTWLAEKAYPIMKGVSEFWASHVIKDAGSGFYITKNETDPDEYANFRNNGAFTNAGIAMTLRNTIQAASILGRSDEVPGNWSDIADKITILYDPSGGNVTLEYEGFNALTPVKQADVVLMTYPLEFTVRNAQEDLAFYTGATSPNGPGMTYSIFGIISAQLSTRGCESFTYLLQSSEPYVRGSFSQFSEQTTDVYADNGGTNPAYTFLTGHGGYLQLWTHGLTGHRFRLDCFYLDPTLPPQLAPDGFTVRGMKWQGSVFDVTVGGKQTTISHRSGVASRACVHIGDRNKKKGKYQLSVGNTLTVPTYRSDLNVTLVPGNKAQCALNVSSSSPIVQGQYALAAVDGSNSTYWRPKTQSPASLDIDLGRIQTIKAFHFNFNNNPPTSYLVYAGTTNNKADSDWKQVGKVDHVKITAPYDPDTANSVMVRLGNTSDITLAQSIRARFIRLVVEGSKTKDATNAGATVAEVVVL
ncbi:alpha,alpha-trehalase ath1 [Gryganskiella cystojenkinii]|nr:alpha,alpha-trehalase ath1 [Gryganskiella cystojenkinii]